MGIRKRERKPLRVPHGFHSHQREEHIERVERQESRRMLSRIFKVKSASEFLENEDHEQRTR